LNPFDDILLQAADALRARLYLPALFTTLTLPDICAAINSDDEEVGPRYRAWVDTYLPSYESAELYRLRCRLLHEGTAILRNAQNPVRYFFVEPGHGSSIRGITLVPNFGSRAAAIDIEVFVADVSQAVQSWLAWGPKRADFPHRLWDMFQRRPSGIPGVIAGVPVFA
jgi:hypothetical protein